MLVREGRKIRRNTRRVFESDEQRLLKSYNKYKKMYDRDWDFGVFGIDSAADLFAIVESIDELIEEINDSTINNKNKIIDDLIKFRDDASSLGDSIEDEEESANYDEDDDDEDDDDDDAYESHRRRRESHICRCSRLEKKSLVRKGNRIVRTEASVPGGVDEDWVIELSHYAAEVKRNQISYLVKNLAKKSNKGIELSVDRLASSSVIDQILRDAIKEYNREYGEDVRISTATRKAAKQELDEIIMQMVGEEKE